LAHVGHDLAFAVDFGLKPVNRLELLLPFHFLQLGQSLQSIVNHWFEVLAHLFDQ